jgi:GPH family glycoside/pentoside/hexuronide:cation symporter
MVEPPEETPEPIKFGLGQKVSFALGNYVQWFINTAFSTWIFIFFYKAVGLEITWILIAFIIYPIWNAINDPLIGYLSDRTHTRFGRRKPYILIGAVPLIVIFIFIWMPPAFFGNSADFANFLYLILILIAYDTAYTMIALPYDSLFPELYGSVEERAEVNTLKQVFATIGLICAFLIPGLLIGNSDLMGGYRITGLVTSGIVGVFLAISIKWGVKERPEFKEDYKKQMGFLEALKYTLKNRAFVLYTIMYLGYQYILLLLGTIVPLYAEDVLGVTDTFITGAALGAMFLVGIATIIIWKRLDEQYGSRKAFAYSLIAYWIPSISLLFLNGFVSGIIFISIMGIGFGGMLYFVYLLIADIVDEDELKTGIRREGTFFGVTNFFMRLAGVFSILTVGLVFSGAGWLDADLYDAHLGINVVFGLRILVFVFPSIVLLIILIALHFYPFSKEKVDKMKAKLEELHNKKLKRVS